jgi:[protein-PII] uridylyltransferase
LYRNTSQYLADQAGFYAQQKIERESLQQAVTTRLGRDFGAEIEAHFEAMPDNYFRAFGVEEIARHLELFRDFLANLFLRDTHPLTPAVAWEPFPEQGHTTVSLCTWDGQQLLAKIAGSFAVVPLNILSADIYTRGDNVVLDVFRVCDLKGRAVTNPKDLGLVESLLTHALVEPGFDFGPLLKKARRQVTAPTTPEIEFPTKIIVDNKSHPNYTLLQIETRDRLGLLYDLLAALGEERVSILLSRISTEKGAAIDTFYVADAESRGKITDTARIGALQKRLQSVVTGTLASEKIAQPSSVA